MIKVVFPMFCISLHCTGDGVGEQVAAGLNKRNNGFIRDYFHIDTDRSEWMKDDYFNCDDGFVNPISREVLLP